jgi:hypothetical protein
MKATRQGSICRKRIVVVSYTWRGAISKPERGGGKFLRANRAADCINRRVRWDIDAVASNYHSRQSHNLSKKAKDGNDENGSALLTANPESLQSVAS